MVRSRSGGRSAGSRERSDRVPEPVTGLLSAPSGRWFFLGRDGRLTAYAAAPGGLARWTEPLTGQDLWDGPEIIQVPRWTGMVTMAQSGEGFVHFVARVAAAADPAQPEIVVATQFQTGRPLNVWHSLGRPKAPGGDPGDPVLFGPVAAVNPTLGSIHVLVSLREGGVVRRSRNRDGNWGPWKGMTDRPYPQEPGVAMTAGGPLEMLVPRPGGADRWTGISKGLFELSDHIATPAIPGTITACETGPKRATYFWRYPGDGSVVAWRRPETTTQGGGLMPLGGAGGRGRPSVTRAAVGGYDCTVLAQLGLEGGVEVTAYVTENEGYGAWWAPLGGPDAQSAQVAVDGRGRLVVAALDKEGGLHLTRQDTAQDGLAFAPWQRVA